LHDLLKFFFFINISPHKIIIEQLKQGVLRTYLIKNEKPETRLLYSV